MPSAADDHLPVSTASPASTTNPLPFFTVKQWTEVALSAHIDRFVVVLLPNITHVFYGRDVGYVVERIVLDDSIEAISATQLCRLGTER